MKILLVDDDAYIHEVVKHMLQGEACEVKTAGMVDDAIEILKNDGPFDLVITDIVMPEKDGTKLAQYVKEHEPQIPVLAITAGMENAQDDYINYASMFADDTMRKPLKKAELIKVIGNLTKGVNILIVDDDADVRELVEGIVSGQAEKIVTATNVKEGIAALKEHEFNVIITDIVMPEEDGTELIKYAKEHNPEVYVLAITGGVFNAQDDYVNFADMFADQTLAKPFQPEELLGAIQALKAKASAA